MVNTTRRLGVALFNGLRPVPTVSFPPVETNSPPQANSKEEKVSSISHESFHEMPDENACTFEMPNPRKFGMPLRDTESCPSALFTQTHEVQEKISLHCNPPPRQSIPSTSRSSSSQPPIYDYTRDVREHPNSLLTGQLAMELIDSERYGGNGNEFFERPMYKKLTMPRNFAGGQIVAIIPANEVPEDFLKRTKKTDALFIRNSEYVKLELRRDVRAAFEHEAPLSMTVPYPIYVLRYSEEDCLVASKVNGKFREGKEQEAWLSTHVFTSEEEVRKFLAIRKDWGVKITHVSLQKIDAGERVNVGLAHDQNKIGEDSSTYPGGGFQIYVKRNSCQNTQRNWTIEEFEQFIEKGGKLPHLGFRENEVHEEHHWCACELQKRGNLNVI